MPCRPLFCDRAPDCHDRACESHPLSLQLHRIPGLQTNDGGKAVQGGFGVSLAAPLTAPAPEPDAPVATPEEAGAWTFAGMWFLAVVALACAAAVLVIFLNA